MRATRQLRSLLSTLGGDGLLVSMRKRVKPEEVTPRRPQVATIPHRFESLIENDSASDFSLPESGGLSDMLTERLQELLSLRVSEKADEVIAPSSSTKIFLGDEASEHALHDFVDNSSKGNVFVPYLTKVLSRTGCCSRRESASIISRGLVTVNGVVVTDLRHICSPDNAIHVVGVSGRLRFSPPRLWIYHKPRNVSSSVYDPQGRKVLMAHAASLGFDHLVPICRLPFSQHGLMLLTNDGSLASYLEHPATQLQHVYRLRVSPSIDPILAQRLSEKGVTVDGILLRNYEFSVDPRRSERYVKARVRGEELPIADVIKSLGRKVQRGGRVSLGPFSLDGLGLGQTREVAIPPSYFQHIGNHWKDFVDRDWPYFRRRRIKSLRTLSKYRVLSQKEMEELDTLSSEEISQDHSSVGRYTQEQIHQSTRPNVDVPL